MGSRGSLDDLEKRKLSFLAGIRTSDHSTCSTAITLTYVIPLHKSDFCPSPYMDISFCVVHIFKNIKFLLMKDL